MPMGFKDTWPRRDMLADTEQYGSELKVNPYKAASALNTLYCSDYDYDGWKNIGISFKCAGGELSDWLAWCSIDAARYDERAATQLFKNADMEGAITANTLWKLAWDAGWDWHERFESLPKVRTIPKVAVYDSGSEQAAAQLEALFKPGEYVNIITDSTRNKHGKLVPKGYGRQYRCADLCADIRAHGIEAAIGGYDREAGVWVRVNPMNGRGIDDASVARHGNALIESDDMPVKDQERLFFELNLPVLAMTNSGGKSLHAIVSVDADGPNHYRDRVQYLHEVCQKNGISIDKANKNPSRLTRLAGVMRGDREQTLLHVGVGAKDFPTWQRQEKSARVSYDHGIEPMDMETPIVLDEEVIEGVMRRGDKMCVAGPSKAYKSFSLVQLAIAVSCGLKWLGWQCKQGRVLYINSELRRESFRDRVWRIADKMDGASRHAIIENMDVWNMRGRAQPLETSKERIIEQAEAKGYDMIILDPIYKLFGGDENSAQEVSAFMLSMDELAMRLNASIVYCHHHSKGAKGGISAQDRFSGSGVYARDCDELVDISPLDLKDSSITEWGWDASATAWRIETVLRDFAPKDPLNVVFEYPLHHVDSSGYLDEFKIVSPQSIGGAKRAQQLKEKRDKKVGEFERWVNEYYEDNEMPLSLHDLAAHFEVSKPTISNWVKKSEKLKIHESGGAHFVVIAD